MKYRVSGDVQFGFSLSRPLYDRRKKSVQDLEQLAWQILRVHTIITTLPARPSINALDEKIIPSWSEFFQSVSMEELTATIDTEMSYEEEIMHILNTNPKVREVVLTLLEWTQIRHKKAGKDYFDATELYNQLTNWSAHRLMKLCTLMACDQFELADPDMSKLDAEQIWYRAVDIFQQIRGANRPKIDAKKRWKVFKDLGIKLKFPKGLEKVNASKRAAR